MSTLEPNAPRGPLNHRDATYYQVRRRRPVLAAFAWLVFGLGTVLGAFALFANEYAARALSNPENNSPDARQALLALAPEPKDLPSKPINVLVLGSDSRGEAGGRSDTLMLIRLDFKRSFISQLSFPRDLYVQIPGYGNGKINAAYGTGGTKRAIETVSALTGEDIQYFFNVDFEAFRRLVNDAGGVYLDVDRYYFNDNSGRGENFEQINIKPGYQKLKGSDALDYVRYRHFDSDFARIARQQLFLSELKRTSRSARGLDNIVDAVHDEVTTNLRSVSRLRKFLQFGLSTEKERIARVTVGSSGMGMRDGQSVVFTSDALIRKAVEEWKNPEFVNERPQKASKPSDVIVAVYNGSKRVGLGTQVGRALEAKGYKVLLGGNAPDDFYQSTSVYYAPERRNDAKALAGWFGPNAGVGERREGMTEDADVIVVVGADYDGLRRPKAAAAGRRAKPDTMTTLSLKPVIQRLRRDTGMDLLVPTHVPRGAEVVYVRTYSVERGDRGKPDAVTIVLRLAGNSRLGGSRYATITQTTMKSPPILKTATATKNGYTTFYDGKTMQRLLWRKGPTTYWITNSLDGTLGDATIRDMAAYMVRPARAKLKANQSDTKMRVDEAGRTP